MNRQRVGASLDESGTCRWGVWAPATTETELVLYDSYGCESDAIAMNGSPDGYFECVRNGVSEGQRYAFRLDGRSPRPDPASRWQPDGVHRPSAVWRADSFAWQQPHGPRMELQDLVIYELHVGTFTPEGTLAAVIPRLAELRDLGVTAIELMPLAQFPGQWGWGYDGVYWFAVQHSHGGPRELQRLVDACHAHGLAVILDVIYNHLGPEGNYLGEFGAYFSHRHQTPWGSAINFDGPDSRAVRDFVLDNVRQWIGDFRIDGLRLDAIHAIHDDSPTSILAEIKEVADSEAARIGHSAFVIAESNLNDVRLLNPTSAGGDGLDAQWSDDFHHCVHTLLTGERAGYYMDFPAPASQLVKALNNFFVYDGCYSPHRKRDLGTPVGDHPGERFVISVQTHDQVGNRACGDRFGTLLMAEQQRLAAGLMLLAPNVPMLFMGEEYGETRPFPFFCDFGDDHLRQAVRRGRREEFAAFGWSDNLPDPVSRETYESAILEWNWPADPQQTGLRTLYHRLLTMRLDQPALRDFRHRHARLLPNLPNADVLGLLRGNPAQPGKCVSAVFNLSSSSVPVDGFGCLPDAILLRSDELQFGGTAKLDENLLVLPPFSFAVYGTALEILLDHIN